MMLQFMAAMMRPPQPTYYPPPYHHQYTNPPYLPNQPTDQPTNYPQYPNPPFQPNQPPNQPTNYHYPTNESSHQHNIPTYHQVSQTTQEHTPFEDRIIYSSSSSYGQRDDNDDVNKSTLS
jgi:hypothetical protein